MKKPSMTMIGREAGDTAFAHDVPWNGIGASVNADLSYKEMLVAAGLDWTVSLRKTQFRGSDKKLHDVPNSFVLARDSDDRPLSSAGGRYKPVQNEEALRFFDRFVRAGHAKLEAAGSLKGGKVIWCLAKLGHNFVLPGGDKVGGYLLLMQPHIVGKSALARIVPMRFVCANMLALANRGTNKFSQRFPHVRDFNADEASELLMSAQESMTKFAEDAARLAKLNLTRDEAVRILLEVYQPDEERSNADLKKLIKDEKGWNPTVRSIFDHYQNAPGAVEGTGWGLLNGATYRANHTAGKDADSRLSTAWIGKEQRRSVALMDNLLRLAA